MVKRNTKKGTSPHKLPSAVIVLGTIGDTTWRMFVPTVGGTLLGVWGDRLFTTKPWWTVVGVTVGTAFAGWLVYRQLKQL